MNTLRGKEVYLRALELTDLDFLYELENDENIWSISNTLSPYSRFTLRKYIENAHEDIFSAKQLRLAICNNNNEIVGLIDMFDFNPIHKRAGLGVVIKNIEQRKKGYAFEALSLIASYAKKHLNMHQLYCNVSSDNKASISLFEKLGFISTGEKRDWNHVNGSFQNENLYQLIF